MLVHWKNKLITYIIINLKILSIVYYNYHSLAILNMGNENNTKELEISSLNYLKLFNFLENYGPCKEFTYNIEKATRSGDNYFSVVYRIYVRWKNCTQTTFIIKVPPKNVLRRKKFFSCDIFNREALAFQEVIF